MTTSSHIIPQNLPFTTAKRVSGGCVNNLLWQICSNQVPPLTGQAHSAMRSGWGWYRRSPHVIETEGPCILEGHGSPDRSYIIPATQCLDCHCSAISIRSHSGLGWGRSGWEGGMHKAARLAMGGPAHPCLKEHSCTKNTRHCTFSCEAKRVKTYWTRWALPDQKGWSGTRMRCPDRQTWETFCAQNKLWCETIHWRGWSLRTNRIGGSYNRPLCVSTSWMYFP